MDDEPSVFKKYIADSLEAAASVVPDMAAASVVPDMAASAKIKPRKAVRRIVDPKNFILDVLVNGPVPTVTILRWGAKRGLTKRQITWAKENMDIIAFKEIGRRGPWFWALPHHEQ
jgi:hypothetical protein